MTDKNQSIISGSLVSSFHPVAKQEKTEANSMKTENILLCHYIVCRCILIIFIHSQSMGYSSAGKR
jgi:hypothetical protein